MEDGKPWILILVGVFKVHNNNKPRKKTHLKENSRVANERVVCLPSAALSFRGQPFSFSPHFFLGFFTVKSRLS